MRLSGILLPIFSLPSAHGFGTLGKSAYDFIDFLVKSRQHYWQVLPIGPTSYGDSPYQSFSTFAGNPYMVDLDLLKAQGLLTEEEIAAVGFSEAGEKIDYAFMFENRFDLMHRAFVRFTPDQAYADFVSANAHWLPDYALFMALKAANGNKSWLEWDAKLKSRESKAIAAAEKTYLEDIAFYTFMQYCFYTQWDNLHSYAKQKGVEIIGDLPIYVAMDSADTWVHPELFMLDETLTPTFVAGCPPDYFSKTGQLWGNPLYRWDVHEKDDYAWWLKRIEAALNMFDVLRIDHFRGFASYYAIPYGDPTAEFGHWEDGPRMKLFKALKKRLKQLNIIAEDLGFLTDDVFKLLKDTRYPGMKVLQFAFDPYRDNMYLPHNYERKCIAYTGTHDNATVMGWYRAASRKEKAFARKYLALTKREGYAWGFIRGIWQSASETAIAPMQDFLSLDDNARINIPSTVGGNWTWRLKGDELTDALAQKIAELTLRYGRTTK